MKPCAAPRLLTVGLIAAELGEPVDRVCRLLRTRNHIRPVAYAGNARLFSNEAVAQIHDEIREIDARREAARRGGGS